MVSVLIPVYNKAPFLRDCLDSVYGQTFQDFEIVAVDDASTDNSLALLKAEHDARLRIIALPRNLGPAGAANAGIEACRGEYIVRLDADDLAVPERLAQQVAYMDAHPEVGASGGWLQLFGARDRTWKFPLTDDDCKAQLLFSVPVSQGASIMRRSVLEAHGLRYDPGWPRVGEDWLFWTRMAKVARFGNLDGSVTLYRRGGQNISHGRDKLEDHAVLLRDILAWFGIPHTAADIDLHLMALRLFRHPPTGERVSALRNWLDSLIAFNSAHGVFPQGAFEKRVEQAWSALFHPLADRSPAAALKHMRISGTTGPKLRYLLGAALSRVTGGSRS